MNQTIQFFLSFESVAAFIVAALVHFGFFANGYEHTKAGIAETVIGTVLALGFIILLLRPRLTRLTGLIVQGFAFLGTLVGGLLLSSEWDRYHRSGTAHCPRCPLPHCHRNLIGLRFDGDVARALGKSR